MTAQDGETALALARESRPDLVVLDVMLPGLDGVEVCRRLRQFSDAYVIMLTARSEEIDKIVGLSVGADDYLTKPFSPRELVARVKAMLRRPRGVADSPTEESAQLHALRRPRHSTSPDTASSRAASEVALTPMEYRLLTTLASAPGGSSRGTSFWRGSGATTTTATTTWSTSTSPRSARSSRTTRPASLGQDRPRRRLSLRAGGRVGAGSGETGASGTRDGETLGRGEGIRPLSRWGGIGGKLFLSYLLVVGVGILTLFLGVSFLAPTLFDRSMTGMMGRPGHDGRRGDGAADDRGAAGAGRPVLPAGADLVPAPRAPAPGSLAAVVASYLFSRAHRRAAAPDGPRQPPDRPRPLRRAGPGRRRPTSWPTSARASTRWRPRSRRSSDAGSR